MFHKAYDVSCLVVLSVEVQGPVSKLDYLKDFLCCGEPYRREQYEHKRYVTRRQSVVYGLYTSGQFWPVSIGHEAQPEWSIKTEAKSV